MYLLEVWQNSQKKLSLTFIDYNDASKVESLIDFESMDVWTQIVDLFNKDDVNNLIKESLT